ncbi:hypothetical protein JTE90_021315 [Oedothorax gibbosus]|uniref:Uncharacterized protein n=1 Tax=Oedothorax gibbosus TaxID=931172 RepID=A0AAV6VNC5_9ARAC|nr:hypothetical protein JTE90_021315 [Oedothorax gibbosus]
MEVKPFLYRVTDISLSELTKTRHYTADQRLDVRIHQLHINHNFRLFNPHFTAFIDRWIPILLSYSNSALQNQIGMTLNDIIPFV